MHLKSFFLFEIVAMCDLIKSYKPYYNSFRRFHVSDLPSVANGMSSRPNHSFVLHTDRSTVKFSHLHSSREQK